MSILGNIVMAALAVAFFSLGLKGFSTTGLPITRASRLRGGPAKIVAVICFLFGGGMLAGTIYDLAVQFSAGTSGKVRSEKPIEPQPKPGPKQATEPVKKQIIADAPRFDPYKFAPFATFKVHNKFLTSLSISPDGKHLITTASDEPSNTQASGEIKLWDLAKHKELKVWTGQPPIAFSEDGKSVFYSAERGMRVGLIHQDLDKRLPLSLNGPDATFAVSRDGKLILLAEGSRLRLADLENDVKATWSHPGSIKSVAFSPNGKRVAAGSYEKISVYGLNGNAVCSCSYMSGPRLLTFSPDGKIFAVAPLHGVRLFDSETGKELSILVKESFVSSLAFSPNGRYLACGTHNQIQLFDLQTKDQRGLVAWAGGDTFCGLAFSPDGKVLAAGLTVRGLGGEAEVKLWNVVDTLGLTPAEANDIKKVPSIWTPES